MTLENLNSPFCSRKAAIIVICLATFMCIFLFLQENPFIYTTLPVFTALTSPRTRYLPFARRIFNGTTNKTDAAVTSHIVTNSSFSTTLSATEANTTASAGSTQLYTKVVQSLKNRPANLTSKLLLVAPNGRLGNELFEIASAYGIARHTGRTLVTLGHFEMSNYLKLSFGEVKLDASMSRAIPAAIYLRLFSEQIYDLVGYEREPVVRVGPYLQSWIYFADFMDDVKRMFQFQPQIVRRVHSFFAQITPSSTYPIVQNSVANSNSSGAKPLFNQTFAKQAANTTYVGVHVRRGDTTTRIVQATGFTPGGADYVARAMLYYVKRFADVTFVVCSDDLAWCKTHIHLPNDTAVSAGSYRIVFCERNSTPVVDMAILAACNHSIITGGSYGWWTAFLAGGQCVWYRGCPREGSQRDRGHFTARSEHYLPQWTPMW